jgi:5-(carboxyamino)imidazole ribonucleotide mutase
MKKGKIAIIMGSRSDLPIMIEAAKVLEELNAVFTVDIVSAHRTPERMYEFAQGAKSNGYHVIIAGAGGAAHLPGMVASLTTLPVIGVPIKSSNSIDGWDSILSILQMPGGVPVATVALNGSKNAGILAAQIIANFDSIVAESLVTYKASLKEKVLETADNIQKNGWRSNKVGF